MGTVRTQLGGCTQIYRLQRISVTLIFWICTIVHDGATRTTVSTDSFEGRWGGHHEAFSRMLLMEEEGDKLHLSTLGGTVFPYSAITEAWTAFCWRCNLRLFRSEGGNQPKRHWKIKYFKFTLFRLNLCLGLDIYLYIYLFLYGLELIISTCRSLTAHGCFISWPTSLS